MDSILGVLLATILSLGVMGGLFSVQRQGVANQKAAVTAGQLQMIATAAQNYVQTNGAAIQAVATAAAPATISIVMLQATGFLPAGIAAVNPYGQTWTVQVLQPSAGVLQALVLSQGGSAIPTRMAPVIAAMVGAEGGFVPAAGEYGTLTSSVAQGAYGGWQMSLAGYTNPGSGHLVALLPFNNGNLTNDYLYRGAVPGQPQLNTMATALDMGGNSISAANNIAARTATFPAGNGVQIGSSYVYGDATNTAVRQSGSFVVQSQDGSAYGTLDAGNINAVNAVVTAQQVDLGVDGYPGLSCAPNGAITTSTDGTGTLLSCVSSVWTRAGGASTTTSFILSANALFGNYRYCGFGGGGAPSGIYPVTAYSDGTYSWQFIVNPASPSPARVNCY